MTKKEYFESVARLLGLELYEIFLYKGLGFYYKFTQNGLVRVITEESEYLLGQLEFNSIIPEKVIKLPFIPKMNERYFFACPTTLNGVGSWIYQNDQRDAVTIKNCGAFRTHNEAQQRAAELGWID
jgi:hypothetical protein